MTPRVKLLPDVAVDPLAADPLAADPLAADPLEELLQAASAAPRMPTAAREATLPRWPFRVDLTLSPYWLSMAMGRLAGLSDAFGRVI
jgi:hypothetical protein